MQHVRLSMLDVIGLDDALKADLGATLSNDMDYLMAEYGFAEE